MGSGLPTGQVWAGAASSEGSASPHRVPPGATCTQASVPPLWASPEPSKSLHDMATGIPKGRWSEGQHREATMSLCWNLGNDLPSLLLWPPGHTDPPGEDKGWGGYKCMKPRGQGSWRHGRGHQPCPQNGALEVSVDPQPTADRKLIEKHIQKGAGERQYWFSQNLWSPMCLTLFWALASY